MARWPLEPRPQPGGLLLYKQVQGEGSWCSMQPEAH